MPQQNNLQSTSQEQSSQKQQTNANNQQTQQRYDYDHNGVYRTPEQKAHEQWIKDQVEWKSKMKLENKSYKMNISIFQIKCMKMELAKPNIILWKTSR